MWPVLVQRYDCKDYLSLFSVRDWKPLAHLALPTQDAAGLAFSPDGTCFAVWESCLDYQVFLPAAAHSALYSASTNTRSARPTLPPTRMSSACQARQIVHEGPLVAQGAGCVAQVLVCGLDGKCLTCYRAYSDALGIKTVAWSPSGQLLAVGSYDQVRHILITKCCPKALPLTAA